VLLGPVGVGKTHLATALGHIAVRRRSACSCYAPTQCSSGSRPPASTTASRPRCADSPKSSCC
jgi:hypothetical protein